MINDSILQRLVVDELNWEPSVNAAHIGVVVKNGVVTLTGFVDSYAARAAAEDAAGRVKGVAAIAQEIEVRLPNAQKRADDEIAERALRVLTWDVAVPDEGIHVKVSHGVVTLSGTVEHYFQRTAAENAIKRLSGVKFISNQIGVVPKVVVPVTPGSIRNQIDAALRRRADIEANNINIVVDQGKVTLMGTTHSWLEKSTINDAVWGAPGVVEVEDRMTVRS
ncbi:MAG TPA: BON domain-containing protein [Rhodopila sp.]|uniref:BON domain-containing protein n=1 Tax=Rhodopila sp. TaxID=2480087 RepID=UPI002C984897|nr:BON domain-containing protein [Rhodopila sp.]HVY14103.1 BON domain-containing protein [Rhodopila sp.]